MTSANVKMKQGTQTSFILTNHNADPVSTAALIPTMQVAMPCGGGLVRLVIQRRVDFMTGLIVKVKAATAVWAKMGMIIKNS
jgi:hypothetical protein